MVSYKLYDSIRSYDSNCVVGAKFSKKVFALSSVFASLLPQSLCLRDECSAFAVHTMTG